MTTFSNGEAVRVVAGQFEGLDAAVIRDERVPTMLPVSRNVVWVLVQGGDNPVPVKGEELTRR